MKFLFDLFPVILFFVAFKFADIYTATIVAMIATIAQILWVYYRHRKIDATQWTSLVLIVVLGALTIFLQDKTFIQLKPTALYWFFAAGLFISAQFFNKNWIQVPFSFPKIPGLISSSLEQLPFSSSLSLHKDFG
jgi:intracellular septation protein